MSEKSIEEGNLIFATEIVSKLDEKVNKIEGKQLSTNDFDNTYKTKLDGIATGATKVIVDSSLSTSSTNPVQNNIVTSALNDKASSSHTHDDRYYTESEINNKITSVDGNGNQISSKIVGTPTSGSGSQGYIRFPGGLVLMWWNTSISGTSEQNRTLPYTGVFKSGYSIQMTGIARTNHAAWPNGLNVYGCRQESSNTYNYSFLAIGT